MAVAAAAAALGVSMFGVGTVDRPDCLLERYRDAKYQDLYAATPGGAASAEATRAAYYLLA